VGEKPPAYIEPVRATSITAIASDTSSVGSLYPSGPQIANELLKISFIYRLGLLAHTSDPATPI
jgi:hypothetical protein